MSENTPDPDCNFGYVVGEKLDSIEKKIDNRAEESDLKNLENKIEELSENFEQLFNEIHLNGYADEIRKLKRYPHKAPPKLATIATIISLLNFIPLFSSFSFSSCSSCLLFSILSSTLFSFL